MTKSQTQNPNWQLRTIPALLDSAETSRMPLVRISTGVISKASETDQASELGFGHWDLGVAAMPYGALKRNSFRPAFGTVNSR